MAGVISGAVCSVLKRVVVGLRGLIAQFLVNVLIFAPLGYMMSLDRNFVTDLEHVFEIRKNVVYTFGVVGLLIPFMAFHLLTAGVQRRASNGGTAIKAKME
jgi:uncharacterized membrane protein (DUF106 family)